MIEFNLKGLVPLLIIMLILSVIGIWKLIEVIVWLINHIRIV